MNPGVLILAAGSASRMKKAKMLLPWGNATILAKLVTEINYLHPVCTCLVTGYYHEAIVNSINTFGLTIIYNEKWEEGIGCSIRTGLSGMLQEYPDLSSLLIMVSDQPFVNKALLGNMIRLSVETEKGMVAASYENTNGTPVLFHQKYFDELLQLEGDKGAKSILLQHPHDVATIGFPLGAIDIDTPEEYAKFYMQNQQSNA